MNHEWRGRPIGAYLRQRNALWQALRRLEPNDAAAEALLLELMALTGWPREKILLGLGWPAS